MSLNNVNNNAYVVNVGRTTPVSPGPQPASKSIPVVVSTDQDPVPVVEQNKIQSEVALSLLGIPRSEVALGIFADVNTYDVNPSEWSFQPGNHSYLQNSITQYTGIQGDQGWGIKHLPEESGALVEAPADETAVLTSKRFFRYQPGRVSSATFGVKSTIQTGDVQGDAKRTPVKNPAIRKFGIFDNYDGYYWDTRDTGQGDQFSVVRRTQSILRYNPLEYGAGVNQQLEDHALAGKPAASEPVDTNEYPKATKLLIDNRFTLAEDSVVSNTNVKCRRDVGYFIQGAAYDVATGSNYNATLLGLAESNSEEYPLGANVVTAINTTESTLKGLTGITGVTNPTTRVDDFFNTLNAVAVDSGTRVDYASATQAEQIAFLKGVTFPDPSTASASQVSVKDKIVANRDFLTSEVNYWVRDNYYGGAAPGVGDHSEPKCTRDVLFVTNAVAYDVLYGGNSATYDAARFFVYDGFAKTTDEHKAQTLAAYEHLKSVIPFVLQGVSISKESKCNRDLEYFIDALTYDITLGSNYNATFQGLAESNSKEYPLPAGVVSAINDSETAILALAGTDATADTRIEAYYDRLRAVAVDSGTRVDYNSTTQAEQIAFLKGVTFEDPSTATTSQIAVKDKIQANYDFLTNEVNSWVTSNYAPTTHSEAKCTRDVLFVANAVAYDMLYGGNSATYDTAKFFLYNGVAQTTDVHKEQTVAAYRHLKSIIDDVLLGTTINRSSGNTTSQVTSGDNAGVADVSAAQALVQVIIDVIEAGELTALPGTRTVPDVAWSASSYKNAKTAIETNKSTVINNITSGYTDSNPETQVTSGNNASITDSTKAVKLIQVFIDVINRGSIDLPETQEFPDISWATAEYVTAANAILDSKQTVIETAVPSLTYSTDDLKCIRDMDFAIDAYVNDLIYGGDGHTSVNSTTYSSALLTDRDREGEVHAALRDNIFKLLKANGESDAAEEINTLSSIMISALKDNNQVTVSNINWGARPKIDTIFSIYDKYLGYLVSESTTYDATGYADAGYASEAEYEEVLKFKCLRDVKFVVNGYAKDLQYGGNASTLYNAYKYYTFNGSDYELVVYSQGGSPGAEEITKHTFLKNLLTSSSNITVTRSDASTVSVPSIADKFSLTSTQRAKLETLADLIIKNFSTKYSGIIDYGSAEQFGDLVILRDGLIMTHAAVYDPSLLKPKKKSIAKVDVTNNVIAMAEGSVIIGQYVNYYGDAGGLTDGKTYYVKDVTGPKENILTLVDPLDGDFPDVKNAVTITSEGTSNFIETPVPFIFPDEYDNTFDGGATRYDGMFPYLYSSNGVLPAGTGESTIGYIDTAINVATDAGDATLKAQIDALNLQYKSWVRDHVDPKYYSVYEYRVPRSRFSGDALDGETRTAVYSDNVLDNRAGENYLEGGVRVEDTSVWDFDFSKVTMLKIEFSWYGAVGALFLAYVPVGNGEARWVRVHHLRCSNQLKISSLGNATLPITYLVYGGGSATRFGQSNADRIPSNYTSYSQNIVKYGASYYIDGGDRGTVRLYNHSSDTPTEIYGSRYTFEIDNTNAADPYAPYIDITNFNGAPTVNTYYMNAKVITGNSQDQNVKVIWVDTDNNRLYLSKPITQVSSLGVIVDRPTLLYGLKTKDAITSGEQIDVRNRVQVYPTRLSVGSEGTSSGKLTLLKTPVLQTLTPTTGSLSITADVDINQTKLLSVTNTEYLADNGDTTYGYFRGYLNGATNFIKVLGRLQKTNDQIYFYPYEIYNGQLIIEAGESFLKEGIYDPEGNVIATEGTTYEKERLSSVEVSEKAASPIPGTGTELASYYISPGAQDFDLATYFDYNKEYISYPLTNVLETLYLSTYSNASNSESSLLSVSASLTWEEQ
jgi:hypothetical protein